MTHNYICFLLSFSLLGCAAVDSDTKLYYSSIDHAVILVPHSKDRSGIVEIREASQETSSLYQRFLKLPGATPITYRIIKVHEVSKSPSVVSEDSFLKLVIDDVGSDVAPDLVRLFYDKHGVNFSGYGKRPKVGQKLVLIFNEKRQLVWVEPKN